jgi:hypothetical protein
MVQIDHAPPANNAMDRRDRPALDHGLPTRVDEIAREKNVDPAMIEIWFADEARIGQKNKITRRWAKRGTRPSAPKDQRTASAYISGAICPRTAKAPRSACCDAIAKR